MLMSIVIYPIIMRNCTPTTCDDESAWFIPTTLVSLGFLVGAVTYKLVGKYKAKQKPYNFHY